MSSLSGVASTPTLSRAEPPRLEDAARNCAPVPDAASAIPAAIVELAPTERRRYRSRLRLGPVAASILLHIVLAAAVLACELWWLENRWYLPVKAGKDSVELQASFAAPPPSEVNPIVVERPERMPQVVAPPDAAPPELEPTPMVVERTAVQPDLPSSSFADLKEDARLPPALSSEKRAPIEAAEANEPQPIEPRKRKSIPAPTVLPSDKVASKFEESLASEASAASIGAKVDVPPTIVRDVKPAYTDASQLALEHGVVKILFRVDSDGKVLSARLVKSSGFRRLDQAVLDVVYLIEFAPTGGGARGKPAEFIWPFTFNLPPHLRARR